MNEQQPQGAVIEIIERRTQPPTGDISEDTIVPNEIRINGQPLLVPADRPVKVHEINIPPDNLVLVTLTLVAKRVVVAAEDPPPTVAEQRAAKLWGGQPGKDPRDG